MEKFEKFFDLIGLAFDYLIIFGGGFIGGFIAWVVLSSSDAGLVAKLGGTALAAIVSMFLTALIWKLVKILN